MWLLVWMMTGGSAFDGLPMASEHVGLQRVMHAVVDESGRVDYALLQSDRELMAKLDAYVLGLEQVNLADLSDSATKIAFFSNVYNACTLKGVMDAWPVDSVRNIKALFGFFTHANWNLGGRLYSLNDIEKEWLRPLDVRIHFTINCASASCPRLARQLFTPALVEAQMEALVNDFLNDETKNLFRDNGVWELSKIFDWYRGDFGGKQEVVDFILRYRKDLKPPRRIHYREYDWRLNGPTQK